MSRLLSLLLAVAAVLGGIPSAIAQTSQHGTVTHNAKLRAGPGTVHAVRGGARADYPVRIAATNTVGDRYKLDHGHWIATFLVQLDTPSLAPPGHSAPAGAVPAEVVSITDGDTIRVRIDGITYPLRYILINTPETGEPFSAEATAANRRLVEGKTVYLLRDVRESDRYGRLLRYVFLADGTHVGAELVRQGYAQVATFPPDVTREAEMRAAQREAMAAGRGLWAVHPPPGRRSREAVPAIPLPAAVPNGAPTVQLAIVANHGREEILEIRNTGTGTLDLGGWQLDGSKGDDRCIIPSGATVAPGAGYQVATGDSQPQGAGFKCAGKPIWNNSGETIYLRAPDGLVLSLEAAR